jgi:acyl-CoA synthetase (AMP-forming)/AMP-acid ligase II/3-oxoacyl-(acyl-carrier-protein) synthase/acyl carrier protein
LNSPGPQAISTRTRAFDPPPELSSFAEVIGFRAALQPDDVALTLIEADGRRRSITYRELDRNARAVAAEVAAEGQVGDRILLIYPAGPEFITALLGCFYAARVGIPAPVPDLQRQSRTLPRLESMLRDAAPSTVLTTQKILASLPAIAQASPKLGALRWRATDALAPDLGSGWLAPVRPEALPAFLQYSSGSTGTPKGVVIDTGRLYRHMPYITWATAYTPDTVSLNWLPHYHDLGLIEGILHPLYHGVPCFIMAPLDFIQRPLRWLRAITEERITHSIGPNFAFELCLRKITAEERRTLDLSSWAWAGNGAEPVRKQTTDAFYATYAPFGLRWKALHPCYGLAEATLFATGSGPEHQGPIFRTLDSEALGENRVLYTEEGAPKSQTIASVGNAILDAKVLIVDPETRRPCPEDKVGEVWIKNATSALGYWNRPEESAATFEARLADTGEGPFLRTGDTGFVEGKEVFLTGRIKDLIIVRGQNHYPHDLEWTVEQLETRYPAIRAGGGIAISAEREGEERVILFQEIDRGLAPDAAAHEVLIGAIRKAIAEGHEIELYAVVLLAAGSLPKTSSGKKARYLCRQAFDADLADGRLPILASWRQSVRRPASPGPASTGDAPEAPARSAQEIAAWIRRAIGAHSGVDPASIDPRRSFNELGLDSAAAVGLSGDLERWLGRTLPATTAFDHPTIAALAAHLAGADPSAVAVPTQARPLDPEEPIAIVSMACRLPGGVASPDDLWRLLDEGRDAISSFPPERGWDRAALLDPDADSPGKTYTDQGGFLGEIDRFDAEFFGISPREADGMDPQQRILLEVSWEALERAGIAPGDLGSSPTGVFVGAMTAAEYRSSGEPGLEGHDGYNATGRMASVLSGRLAYTLGLVGPALTIDTACSSSLVALHLACQSLRAGESDRAIAAGVTVMTTPASFVEFSRLRALSPSGRARSFSAAADGTTWAEGCAAVVLMRHSDAVRLGHRVVALVRGTAVNQDGKSQSLTAPNGPSQERVIRRALSVSGLRPDEIDVVEAHGTGTPLGDPIEATALGAVFGPARDRPLLLGSLKSNLGHTQAAAGLAGVIKIALALEHERLPQTLHAAEPSRQIAWERDRLSLLSAPAPWPRGARLRRAGVSSFGFSGTNAHAVIEEPPRERHPAALSVRAPRPFLLSARTAVALGRRAEQLALHVGARPELELGDLAHTLAGAGARFQSRAAIVARDRGELSERLRALAEGGDAAPSARHGARRSTGARWCSSSRARARSGRRWRGSCSRARRCSPIASRPVPARSRRTSIGRWRPCSEAKPARPGSTRSTSCSRRCGR